MKILFPKNKNAISNRKKRNWITFPNIVGAVVVLFCLLGGHPTLYGQISGQVYFDFNNDGQRGEFEHGVANISVSALDSNDNQAVTQTNADGAYTIDLPSCTGTVRIFLDIDAYNANNTHIAQNVFSGIAQKTATGTGNSSSTNVTFVSCNQTNVDFGVLIPMDFCEANPPVVVPCYVGGNPTGDCTGIDPALCSATSDVLVAFDYDQSGVAAPDDLAHIAVNSQTGSLWGVAYDRVSQQLYTSAVLRPFAGFGPLGTGGIYKVDLSGGVENAVPENFLDLNTVCDNSINTGDDPHIPLEADKSIPAHDTTAIVQTGKMSLGGLALSEDGRTLWTVNILEKTLIGINVVGGNVSCEDIQVHDLPFPCDNESDFYPWAVSIYRGSVFVGTVCSNESGAGDFYASVYEFKPDEVSWNNVLTVPLNYVKGATQSGLQPQWNAWLDYPPATLDAIIYPQPILADLVFDGDGSMVIGLMDRTALQAGYENLFYPGDNGLYSAYSGGDILRGEWNGTIWILEDNAAFPSVPGSPIGCGADNNQGIGGGEFYCGDDWELGTHKETSLGSLAILLGSGDVMSGAYDPTDSIFAGGVQKYSNLDGSNIMSGPDAYSDDFAVYHGGNEGTLGKAVGIGDVELLCGAAPFEIGNRVWMDSNENGLQDPDEMGIEGVNVQLVDAGGIAIASVTTAADGSYYFNSQDHDLSYDTNYNIFINSNEFLDGSALFGLELINIGATDPYFNSDGNVDGSGNVTAFVATGTMGQSNHNYDFGFKSAGTVATDIDLSLTKVANNTDVVVGNNVTYTLTVENSGTVEATNIQVQDILADQLTFVEFNTISGTFENDVWSVPSIPAGTSLSINIVATVGELGTITNTAEIIAHDQTDIDSTPNNQVAEEDDFDDAVIIGIEQSDCIAEAGVLEGVTETTILVNSVSPSLTVTGQQLVDGFIYLYLLVTDLDETDDIQNNILDSSVDGSFDFGSLSLPTGTYYVQGVSFEGTEAEFLMLGLQSTDALEESITTGLCADVMTNGFQINLTDECLANAGTVAPPANLEIASGATSGTPTVSGQYDGAGFSYLYVLTTDLVEGDDIAFNIIEVNETGSFDFTALGLPDGTYDVHGLSFNDADADLIATFQTGETLLQSISGGLCADLALSAYTLTVGDTTPECLALAGIVTPPDLLTYTHDQETNPPTVSGQYEGQDYIYFYIITTDLIEGDGVQYDFIQTSTTGIFSLPSLSLEPGNYPILAVSFAGTEADFQNLDITNGEDLLNKISEGLCADAIVPAYTIIVEAATVTPPECIANAGTVTPPSVVDYTEGQSTEAPTVSGQTTADGYNFYYILTTDLSATPEVYDIIDANTTGIFDLDSYGVAGGNFQIHGFSIEGVITDVTSAGASTGEAVVQLISDGTICAQLLVPGYTITYTGTDCLADAGTIIPPEETDLDLNQALVPFDVEGNYTGDGYIYVALLTIDLDETDDIENNIVAFNQSGGFNFGALGLETGTYEVFGLSVEGAIENFPDFNFENISQILAAIDTGLCAELATGFIVTVNQPQTSDCIADAGTVTQPSDVVLQIGEVSGEPTVQNQTTESGYIYLYAITTDFTEGDGISANIIQVNGSGIFDSGALNLGEGTYEVYGISYQGTVSDFETENFDSIEELIESIVNGEFCADVVENSYTLFVETECDGVQTACAETSLISQVPTVLCPEFCTIGSDYLIIDVQSAFNCSVHLTDDSLCVEYLPLPGFPDGSIDSVTIVACIPETVVCDTSIFYINVGCHDPMAEDDAYTAFSGIEMSLDVLTNDGDPCEREIEIQQALAPENAVVEINNDGTLSFTAEEDYTGTLIFPYQICNDCGACDEGTVVVTVEEPVTIDAVADMVATDVGIPISIDVLVNDIGAEIMITGFTEPENGTVQFVDGELVYTPNADFVGVDFFTYTITDIFGDTDEAVVTITVGEVTDNQPPIAIDDPWETNPMNPITIDVLENDVDPEGGNLDVTEILNQPPSGTVVLNEDETITYIPDPNAPPGDYTFEYVVCDDGVPPLCDTALVTISVIEVVIDSLMAIDDNLEAVSNTENILDVLSNDEIPDGVNVTVAITDPPVNGTAVVNEDGTITYTPNPGFEGSDLISYEICDDNVPPNCDEATVLINVSQPVVVSNIVAVDDTLVGNLDTELVLDVLANDSIPADAELEVSIITPTVNGIATVNEDGTITYNPNPGFEGSDLLVYEICDTSVVPPDCDTAQVVINVVELMDLEAHPDIAFTTEGMFVDIDVLANDIGDIIGQPEPYILPSNGALVINGGVIQYQPEDGFLGTDYFFYFICDANAQCDSTVVSVTVQQPDQPNQNPTLGNDQGITTIIDPVTINVLANDSDPDNDPLTVTEILNPPTSGTVVINEDGTITYTPEEGTEPGEYFFEYVACDDGDPPLCDTAMVVVAVGVSLSNNPPIAVDDNDIIYVNDDETGESIVINIVANDSDPNGGQSLTTKFGSAPSNGTVEIDPTGLAQYTPNEDFTGTDYFLYIVCDNGNPALGDTALVTIEVLDTMVVMPPDPPYMGDSSLTANPDIVQTLVSTSVEINVLDNDIWEGEVSIKGFTEPEQGVLIPQPDADNPTHFTYIPQIDSIGYIYFTYAITDTSNLCDTTVVSIEIFNGPNQPPYAGNNQDSTGVNTPITIDVLANDSDPENGTLTITQVINGPTNGSFEVNADGTITYSPNADFMGEDSFDYVVCDNGDPVLCDTATVVIAVGTSLTNDPPIAQDYFFGLDVNGNLFFDLLPFVDQNPTLYDPNGDEVNIAENTFPENGTLVLFGDGEGSYVPPTDFEGLVYFLYVLCDDGFPILCDTGVVTIQVGMPIEPPVIDGPPIEAAVDVYFTPVNQPIDINIIANDTGEGIEICDLDEPDDGLLVEQEDGTFQYIPNLDFEGTDYFTYTICDTLGQMDSTIVSITVFSGANLAPRADNDCISTEVDIPVDISILVNDVDPENDTLMVLEIFAPSAEGAFPILNQDGMTVNYIPPAGFVGYDVFEYAVWDGFPPGGLADTGVVVVKVGLGPDDFPNHPPKAQNLCDTLETLPYFVDLSTLVSDIDTGQTFSYEIISQPAQGDSLISVDPLSGIAVLDAQVGEIEGTDYFIYRVCDSGYPDLGLPEMCDTAYVKFVVPDSIITGNVIANNDTINVQLNTPQQFNVLVNDLPNDGSANITVINGPSNGTILQDSLGLFTYTPTEGFEGIDSLIYILCLGSVCDTATVILNVQGCTLDIKKGISPNNDGINDVFDIPMLETCYGEQNPEILIYNRWGNLVYQRAGYLGLNDLSSWDGNWQWNGEPVPDGTYYYILRLLDNPNVRWAGYIEVLR